MFTRGKYKTLTLETKDEILKKVENGECKTKLAADYGIKKNTLSTYLKNKASILDAWEKSKFAKERKRMRNASQEDLEKALLMWFKDARSRNFPINGPLLQVKADELASRMDIEDFKCSDGWLSRFKSRHNISYKNVCGQSSDVNEDVCNIFGRRLPELLSTYLPKDIFNADETALFYKLLPNKTLHFKGDACVGGKSSKQRITALVCANMDGSEKLKLLVIGKSKNPRCFTGIKTLPVDYVSNTKAWMTQEIFSNWLKGIDKQFSRQKRKILLFVDNASCHNNLPELSSIQVEYLPPNTTAKLQPMDQGIIQNLKINYRKRLLKQILFSLDCGENYDITLLTAINDLYAAWDAVKESTIRNSFRHAKFMHAEESNQIEECDTIDTDFPEFKKFKCDNVTFTDYVSVDEDVEICGKLNDDEIIKTIREDEKEETLSDSDETEETFKRPNDQAIMDSIKTLKAFIQMEPSSEKELKCLLQIEKLAEKCRHNRQKQTSVLQFFPKV